MINVSLLLYRLKENTLFKDSFWALLGSAMGKGLSLIAGVVIARLLGSELYGEYGTIKNTLLMIAIFSSLGLGYSATKFIAESRTANDNKRISDTHKIATVITLLSSSIIALLLIFASNKVALWLESPHLSSTLRLSSIAVIFNALNTTQIGELSGFGAYKELARNNTIAGVFTFCLSVLFTYLYDFNGAILALNLSLIFNAILNTITIKKCIGFKSDSGKIDRLYVKNVLRYSIPIALQECLYSITYWLNILILVKFSNYTEIGILTAANQWMSVILFIPGALRNVALTHLSASNNDKIRNKSILQRLFVVNFVSTFIPFLIILFLSGWLTVLYGDSFDGIRPVLNVCVFTAVISSLSNVLTQEFMAYSQNWFLFISRLIRDIGILTSIYVALLYFDHGALISAVAGLIWQLFYLGILLVFSRTRNRVI